MAGQSNNAALRLLSPGMQASNANMTPTGDPRFDARKAQIMSGEDVYEPTDLELHMAQREGPLENFSRDQIRDSGYGALKRTLRMEDDKVARETNAKLALGQQEGEYGIKQQEAGANILAEKLGLQNKYQMQRQDDNQAALMERLIAGQGAQDNRQEDAQAFKQSQGGTIPPAVRNNISMERQKLVLAQRDKKNVPSLLGSQTLGRMIGRQNPVDAQLEQFDNASRWAEKLARDYPGMSLEEALNAAGISPDPNEMGQLQKFHMMMTGR